MATFKRIAAVLVISTAGISLWTVGDTAAKWAAETGTAIGPAPVVEAADGWLTRAGTRLKPVFESADEWLTRAGSHVGPMIDSADGLLTRATTVLGFGSASVEAPGYRFAEIARGDVLSAVVATGTLQPVATVLVGTQVSGQVMDVPADFNSEVSRGEVIALIDPVSFEIAVDEAAADLDVAEAAVLTAQAELLRARAEFDTAGATVDSARAETNRILVQVRDFEKDSERKTTLAARGNFAVAELGKVAAELDMARAQHKSLLAQEKAREASMRASAAAVKAAESRIGNAKAVVRQKQAALRHARTELERTVIRAPVDGVVIFRDIDAGQTVAASLQAPTLFTIAQDLRQMQVEASIDESEIGRIAPGQEVHFTVDAHPDQRFTGAVTQIRLAPKTSQNVVTYTVIVSAKNPDLLLLPGMTATARFLVAERRDVLTVPTAALRVRIPGAPDTRGQSRLWVEENGTLRHIPAEVGLTDGTTAEVSGRGLEEGQRVVVGIDAVKRTRSAGKRLIGAF
jgi:HlyD family secretion protein